MKVITAFTIFLSHTNLQVKASVYKLSLLLGFALLNQIALFQTISHPIYKERNSTSLNAVIIKDMIGKKSSA